MNTRGRHVSRRSFLFGAGGVALAACSESSSAPATSGTPTIEAAAITTAEPTGSASTPTTDAPSTTASVSTAETAPTTDVSEAAPPTLSAADFDGLALCALLPDSAAGPFPTLDQLVRSDVTEGYPGHPLRLGVRVVDTECRPVQGAGVEIWHTDATGDYSSYEDGGSGKDEGDGSTFMRGFQTTNAEGITEFQTIYPGWYEGRAVHIHTRVRLDGDVVLTAQLYFAEPYTAQVYASAPYAEFGLPDTTWATDGLIGDPSVDGTGIVLADAPTWSGDGTLGLVNMGVRA